MHELSIVHYSSSSDINPAMFVLMATFALRLRFDCAQRSKSAWAERSRNPHLNVSSFVAGLIAVKRSTETQLDTHLQLTLRSQSLDTDSEPLVPHTPLFRLSWAASPFNFCTQRPVNHT